MTRTNARPRRTAAPRSHPREFRQRNVPRKWRYRLAPAKRRPKGILTFWDRARRLLWSSVPWGMVFVWATWTHRLWGAIGSGLMAVFCHLIGQRERVPRYGLEHDFPVASTEFLNSVTGATGVPFSPGNRLEVLNNGDEFYPPMLQAIRAAQHSITIEAYIYWAGEIGLTFAEALAARAKSGVIVKILLDAIGSATIGEEILTTLESGGCQVAWYNPIRWYTLERFNNRTHRKSLIIDGRIGFTGGAGIADHWLGCAQDAEHWRDVNVRIEGPAVIPLQHGFGSNWLETTGEMLSGDLFYPEGGAPGSIAIQTILSSPQVGSSSVRTMYFLSMVSARTSIHIANPYFVPDQASIDTLVDAQKRGVDVKILVSGRRNDNWLARHNSVRLFGRLLTYGVEIHEYNRTMLHHKTMVVDGLWATVGTTNFDTRSFAHNEENNVCFYDRGLVARMERIFAEDLALSEPMTLQQWRRRGWWARMQEFVAAFLQEQV